MSIFYSEAWAKGGARRYTETERTQQFCREHPEVCSPPNSGCTCNVSDPNAFGKRVDEVFINAYDQYRYAFLELKKLLK